MCLKVSFFRKLVKKTSKAEGILVSIEDTHLHGSESESHQEKPWQLILEDALGEDLSAWVFAKLVLMN